MRLLIKTVAAVALVVAASPAFATPVPEVGIAGSGAAITVVAGLLAWVAERRRK